ncbi:unnamed protein product [Rotaria sp. Silwood1]|nr:unnamed protein product [Rotaria sp. Silwood1]
MEDSLIQLNDLPDEILMMILKKLHSCDVLYSLIGVNKRLDTIVQDSFFTAYLTLTVPPYGFLNFTDPILDRFCSKILPKIHHKIGWINVESSSMERFLRSKNYPNLYGLGLCHLASETARDLFTASQYDRLIFGPSPPRIFSSTLLQLRVVVETYEDCLYLLDGRFHRLNTFYVTICSSDGLALPLINNEKKLPNLQCFTLILKSVLLAYNNFLIPLLHRMLNLEELSLCFINHNTPIIDGNDLKMNIMNYMTKLKKFKFNIHSVIPFNNQINLPSNEHIQHTFKNFANKNQIISSIDCFPKANEFHCHIYSYPYIWTDYDNITNNFRGGLFKSVLKLSLVDERPFEHEFFLRIAKSFPCVKELHVHNRESQKNDNQQWSIIEYSYLTQLDLVKSHENYVQQFLNNTKVSLLHNIYLRVDYNTLQRVTDNFTSDTTRMNCSKIKYLILYNQPEFCSPNLKDYFAHAEIW